MKKVAFFDFWAILQKIKKKMKVFKLLLNSFYIIIVI